MTIAQYESIRSDAKRFAVVPGHEDVDVARVIERHSGFFVVEKIGKAAEVAVEHDPRR